MASSTKSREMENGSGLDEPETGLQESEDLEQLPDPAMEKSKFPRRQWHLF